MPEHQMPKQHYERATYRTQLGLGYLVKRAHSMMLDIMEPVFEARGFTFIQYVIMSWLRDGIAVNPKDICVLYRHDSGALTRVIDQLAGRETIESLVPLVVEKLNAALEEFSSEEAKELQRLLIKLNTKLQSVLGPEAARASETPPVEA
jgi:hypothetical protein